MGVEIPGGKYGPIQAVLAYRALKQVQPLKYGRWIRQRNPENEGYEPKLVRALLDITELALPPGRQYAHQWKENQDGMELQFVLNIRKAKENK